MYYQSPKLAGSNTRLCNNLKWYYETGSIDYLVIAINEVKLYSSYSQNPKERIGLQNRNDIRAIILDSKESLLYSNPHDELVPKDKIMKVTLEKTVISRGISRMLPKSNNLGDYYIWRTMRDDIVRAGHQILEGKVFKHEDNKQYPGEAPNCRCYKEDLPINAEIIEQENKEDDDEYERSEVYSDSEIIRNHITCWMIA